MDDESMNDDNRHHQLVGYGQIEGGLKMDYHRKQGNTSSATGHYKGRVGVHEKYNRNGTEDPLK
jgi:hypothetical protein